VDAPDPLFGRSGDFDARSALVPGLAPDVLSGLASDVPDFSDEPGFSDVLGFSDVPDFSVAVESPDDAPSPDERYDPDRLSFL
jgi:hypothetical protein